MAFGDFVKKVAPFGGRILGFADKDREKFKPQKQHWGGSEAEAARSRERFKQGEKDASKTVNAGLAQGREAAMDARNNFADSRYEAGRAAGQFEGNAAQDRGYALGAGENYNAGRAGALQNAGRLEQLAQTAPQQYQQTAQAQFAAQQQANRAQFAAQQNANERAALTMAAGRGASGLRTALASSTAGNMQAQTAAQAANAQAAMQAQIIQAQEQNQLLGMQQGAYQAAAGIRQNQGAQDLNAAGVYSQREQAANAGRMGAQGLGVQINQADYGAQANAAGMEVAAGTNARGQYLGAQAAQGSAELGAAREQEGQRQQYEKNQYTQDWYPLKKFNSPA